jgi:Toastrack DUF4097
MRCQVLKKTMLTIAGAMVVALAADARTAVAQDARVQVTVTIPDDVVREVRRLVDVATGPDLDRQVNEIVRAATRSFRSIGRDVRDYAQDRNYQSRQTDRQTRTLALGASGTLELDNVIGDISVTAGTQRDVTVEIVREARGRTDADAKLGLEQVTAEVDTRGDRATVRARYPTGVRRSAYVVSVSYVVKAPAGTRIVANSISGDIVVRDIAGDVAVQVTSGDITVSGAKRVSTAKTISGEVTVTDCESDGTLDVGSISGDITLRTVKARRITASITSGDIVARDMTAESVELRSLSGSVEYAGALARNGRYELQSHSGDVHLTSAGAVGFELQASTFSGSIRPDSALVLRGSTTSRRSLRGTVGDGAAVVQLTTFSGDIIISRQ